MTVYVLSGFGAAIDGTPLVQGIDLNIAAGEAVALAGASGSGKSLTAFTPFGLSAAQGLGSARLNGMELLGQDEATLSALRARNVGFVFQQPLTALSAHYRVARHLTEAACQGGGPRPDEGQLADLLRETGFADPARILRCYPHQLSGGERQRVMIACAIAHQPRLLIADEPTAALDAPLRRGVMELLDRLRRERQLALLIISHDLPALARHADRIVMLDAGRVAESAPARQMVSAPQSGAARNLVAAIPRLDEAEPALPAIGAPLLRVDNLSVRFRAPGWRRPPIRAVDSVSFDLAAGEAVALVGGSGSGKSTIGRAIAGLGPISDGQIIWQGTPLPARRSRAHRALIQPVFQDPVASLDPRWPVDAVIGEPLAYLPHEKPAPDLGDLLNDVSLPASLASRPARSLSGGQAQRVAIARALAANAQMLVLDEATSALDPLVAAEMVALFARLQRARGLALLFITHDIALARRLCHRIIVLDQGRIVESGPATEMVKAPQHDATQRLVAASGR